MPQQNIEVGLRFTADTSNASRQVAKLKDDISKAIQNASIMGKDGKPLEGYVQQAAQFRGILEAATNEAGISSYPNSETAVLPLKTFMLR